MAKFINNIMKKKGDQRNNNTMSFIYVVGVCCGRIGVEDEVQVLSTTF